MPNNALHSAPVSAGVEPPACRTPCLLVPVLFAGGFLVFPYHRNGLNVPPGSFLFCFGHEALIAICCLEVLGGGLGMTGALEPASRIPGRMLHAQPNASMLVVLILCTVASSLYSSTRSMPPLLAFCT